MHIDIDECGIAGDEQRRRRVAVTAEQVMISGPQRAVQHPVPHRAAVDKEVLRHRGPARIGGQGGIAGHPKAFAGGVDLYRVFGEFRPKNPRQAAVQGVEEIALFGIGAKAHPAFAAARDIAQDEPHRRFGHGEAFDDIRDGLGFGPVGAHELEPRGRCVE